MKRLFWITVLIFAQFGGGLCQVGSQIYPISENAKFGFADTTGKIVISPQFDWASDFHNGLARVEISGKKGFVDTSGKVVIKPQYDEAGDLSEGLAVVSRDYRSGYIDVTGNEVIPLQFIEALPFSEGLAAVYIQSKDSRQDSQWGYVNAKGNIVIPSKFYKAYDFHDGVAKVIVGNFGADNKQGFIDKTGKFVVEPKYELTGEYSEGLIPVEIGGKDEKTGERIYNHVDGKWGYIDASGKVVIPPKFDFADEFSEGLANVTIGDKYGYIDKTGTVVIAPQFEYSSSAYQCANFVEGRACFERGGKIGFIDKKGQVIIQPQFEFVTKFSDGIARVDFGAFPGSENERFPIKDNFGLIGLDGRIIYKPKNKNSTSDHQPEPVNPALYEGWRKIEEKAFSFYAPNDVQGGKQRGIDTSVYRYDSSNLRISFDIGVMANPRPKYPANRVITIDGQEAGIWHSVNSSHLHLALGANYVKTQFNMYVYSNDPNLQEIAEKMFLSLRFK